MIRNDRPSLGDTFLIVAALTVLALRVYLAAAHYPQLGGDGLHIAHVLWGGLLMAVAIGILLSLLSRQSQLIAAVIGGAGFGLFIDELGKFLTSDNNYFFKPTASLVYATFAGFFLAVRELRRYRRLSQRENLVNAIESAKELAVGPISFATRAHALAWLAGADPVQPLTLLLRRQFEQAPVAPERHSRVYRWAMLARARYATMMHAVWFRRVVIAIFCVQAAGVLLTFVYTAAVAVGAIAGSAGALAEWNSTLRGGPIIWTTLLGTLVTGGFTVAGVAQIPRSRRIAYRSFETALLIDLLLVQPFTLLDTGFAGLTQALIDLGLLVALRYMQAEERALHSQPATAAVAG
ncbi:MAG TPA: hypothetical protein VI172_12100 [Candidatus Dormibacteraeota bacterium]